MSKQLPFDEIDKLSDTEDSVFRICPLETAQVSETGAASDDSLESDDELNRNFNTRKAIGYGDTGEVSHELLGDRLQTMQEKPPQLQLEDSNRQGGRQQTILATDQFEDAAIHPGAIQNEQLDDLDGADMEEAQDNMVAQKQQAVQDQDPNPVFAKAPVGDDQRNPQVVQDDLIKMTPGEVKLLPNHGLSIIQLLLEDDVPVIRSPDSFSFSKLEPDTEFATAAKASYRPASSIQANLEKGLDQAIKQGFLSITVIKTTGKNNSGSIQRRLPLKALYIWKHLIDAAAARKSWSEVTVWLDKRRDNLAANTIDKVLNLTRNAIWKGNVICGENNETITKIATLLSDEWLHTGIVDIMVSNLAVKYNIDELRSRKRPHGPVFLAGTELGIAIQSIPENHQPALAPTVLSRLQALLQTNPAAKIYTVVNIASSHYIVVRLRKPDADTLEICCADSMGSSRYPIDFVKKAELWAGQYFPNVQIKFDNKTISVPRQLDHYSCGMIAINTIQRQLDPTTMVWEHTNHRELRARAFLDIMKGAPMAVIPVAGSIVGTGGQAFGGEDMQVLTSDGHEEEDQMMGSSKKDDDKGEADGAEDQTMSGVGTSSQASGAEDELADSKRKGREERNEMMGGPEEYGDQEEADGAEDRTMSGVCTSSQASGAEDKLADSERKGREESDEMMGGSEEYGDQEEAEGVAHRIMPLPNYRILRSHSIQQPSRENLDQNKEQPEDEQDESDMDDLDEMRVDEDPTRPRKRLRGHSSDEDKSYADDEEDDDEEEEERANKTPRLGQPQRKKHQETMTERLGYKKAAKRKNKLKKALKAQH